MTERARALGAESVRSALERIPSGMVAEEHTSVEGTFTIIRTNSSAVLAVVEAISPHENPFDELIRDKVRNVAARLNAPYFIVTNFRRVVTYRTEAVTRRTPDEENVVGWHTGGDVTSLDDVRLAAQSVNTTSALRTALTWLEIDSALPAEQRATDAAAFFAERVTALFEDLAMCTASTPAQRLAVLRLGTSVLAYVLLHLRRPEELDRLSIPYGMRSANLMLDVVGAYFRDARRRGYGMLPADVSDVHIIAKRTELFQLALTDIVHFLHRFDPERLSDTDLHRAVDVVLQRCARSQGTSVPTIDAIDLALRACAHVRPHKATLRMLELGPTQGLISVRQALLNDGVRCHARIYAPTPDDERAVVLRASGRMDESTELRILRDTRSRNEPWDIVAATITDIHDRHRIRLLLDRLPLSNVATVLLFMPMSVLHDEEFGVIRSALTHRYSIEWVFVSDAEALSEPDTGMCCIIARVRDEESESSPARFVYLRQPIAAFFPTSRASRQVEQSRLKALDAFVAYLDASERGKLNDEAVVRMVPQDVLLRASSWQDYLVPPDILASILRKTMPKVRPLRTIADVTGGLRTGANDVFAPSTQEIATEDLEPAYWQRLDVNESVLDNLILTAVDDVETINGLPRTDRRLLLLPEDRAAFVNTNVLTRIERAERDGIHLRPSVRHRDPWWHLPLPVVPTIVLAKQQPRRWLASTNPASAFISDTFIGCVLHNPAQADAIALWLNSTVGLFMSELVRPTDNMADITVRDTQEFPIPTDHILESLEMERFQRFAKRPIADLATELGAASADGVRQETVVADRRRLDSWFMSDVFGLTDEEQRWVYRFTYAWWKRPRNVRALSNALAYELMRAHNVRAMSEWYTPLIDQLPDVAKRTVIIDSGITSAEVDGTMFGWRVVCKKGAKSDVALEAESREEAELIAHLVELGKVWIDVPLDQPIVAEILPRVRAFRDSLSAGLSEVLEPLPRDLRADVRSSITTLLVG